MTAAVAVAACLIAVAAGWVAAAMVRQRCEDGRRAVAEAVERRRRDRGAGQ